MAGGGATLIVALLASVAMTDVLLIGPTDGAIADEWGILMVVGLYAIYACGFLLGLGSVLFGLWRLFRGFS